LALTLTMASVRRSKRTTSGLRARLDALVAPEETPEVDQEDDLSAARVAEGPVSDDDDAPVLVGRSALRAESALSLAASDPRYRGRRISRKDLATERGDLDEREHQQAEWGGLFEMDESDHGDDRQQGDESEPEGDEEEGEEDQTDDDDDECDTVDGPRLVNDNSAEVARGRAVQAQLKTWERLLEVRIQMQKLAAVANRLPQPSAWQDFTEAGDEAHGKAVNKAQVAMVDLLDELLEAKVTLVKGNEEVRRMLTKRNHVDEENEEEDLAVPAKRQKLKAYSKVLAEQQERLKPYRDAVVQKWNDRTRLAASSKSMSAFESSTLKQIEFILTDKTRLVRRTKVKRSAYRVLGREEAGVEEDQQEDEEIFDDDDFYHQLLRELIDRKTSADVTDASQLGKHWLQLQKLRTKAKKSVDTKASKGRKTRYDIHAKLVNFMAPAIYSEWEDAAKNELFSSLFGQHNGIGRPE